LFKTNFKIGNSNIIKSKLGFGCWGLGGGTNTEPSYGEISPKDVLKIIDRALTQNINFFDTSPAYGISEKILGKILKKKKRDTIFLASKCGISKFSEKKNFNPEFLNRQLDKSLNDLETDYLDLVQLHNPEEQILRNLDLIKPFIEEKKKGKIRAFGLSLKKPSDFFYVKNLDLIDSIQINLNILDTRVFELGIEKECKKNNIAVISRTPFSFGFLTGKINAYHYFPENDHRSLWGNAQKKKWVDYSKKLYGSSFFSKKISQAQLCLRFCMSFQDVLITIAGMISEKEVLENSAVLGMKPMSNRQIQYIIKFNKEVEPFINS
jgi:aryl-alcohol dehydrogenase-like predicted oxidoreductase